ncbi:MAG: HutD/Ves family protein [Arenimonas sp.]
MHIQLIPANEYQRIRWKNGLGWTREIARHPVDADNWEWRLSIAEVDKDGPFSAFENIDRELVLLSGEGMRLNFADGESVTLNPPHDKHRFAGERELSAELINGPTQDFNLMWQRDRYDAQVLHRPLVGPMVFFSEKGVTWAIYMLSGIAQFKDRLQLSRMQQGDSALLLPDEIGGRLILDGGGEVLLVKLVSKN